MNKDEKNKLINGWILINYTNACKEYEITYSENRDEEKELLINPKLEQAIYSMKLQCSPDAKVRFESLIDPIYELFQVGFYYKYNFQSGVNKLTPEENIKIIKSEFAGYNTYIPKIYYKDERLKKIFERVYSGEILEVLRECKYEGGKFVRF